MSSEWDGCDNYGQSRDMEADSVDPTDEVINVEWRNNSEYKDHFSEWEPVKNTGIPSWRRDLLPEEEPKEMSYSDWIRTTIPLPYEFSLMSAIQKFKPETRMKKKLFLDKRLILESSLGESEEAVLWSQGGIVTTTKNGIKQSRKDRERERREGEKYHRKDFRDDSRGSNRYGDRRYRDPTDPRDRRYEDQDYSKERRSGERDESRGSDQYRDDARGSKRYGDRIYRDYDARDGRYEDQDCSRDRRSGERDDPSGSKRFRDHDDSRDERYGYPRDRRYEDSGQDEEQLDRNDPWRKQICKSGNNSPESEYGEDRVRSHTEIKQRTQDDGDERKGLVTRGHESARKTEERGEGSKDNVKTEETQNVKLSYKEWKAARKNATKK